MCNIGEEQAASEQAGEKQAGEAQVLAEVEADRLWEVSLGSGVHQILLAAALRGSATVGGAVQFTLALERCPWGADVVRSQRV